MSFAHELKRSVNALMTVPGLSLPRSPVWTYATACALSLDLALVIDGDLMDAAAVLVTPRHIWAQNTSRSILLRQVGEYGA
jgi:hypothetical protein